MSNNIINKYLEYTARQESPLSYHVWSFLSAIASTVGRRCWLDQGFYTIYPNLYVVLIGGSAETRKTVSASIAVKLIKKIPDVIISADWITPQALIIDLQSSTRTIDINGTPYIHASLSVFSKEFSVFLGSNNNELLSTLTDLYDCHEDWEYKTKRQGINTLKNVCLNILACSTSDWMVGSIPLNAIGGGFTSRVLFIVEHEVRHKQSRMTLSPRELQLRDELKAILEEISLIKGEFFLTQEAGDYFDNWYDKDNTRIVDPRFCGYSGRKHVHLLKVAMLLAIADRKEGIIEKVHITRALKLLNSIEGSMVKAFGAAGRSPLAPDIDEILKVILENPDIEHRELQSRMKMQTHPRDFDYVINMLVTTGEVQRAVSEGKIRYSIIKKEVKSE